MYCRNCGKEIDESVQFCQFCGEKQVQSNVAEEVKTVEIKNSVSVDDKGGFLWGLLGFLVPIVGLILYLCWQNEMPKNAKAVGTGALISAILALLPIVIVFFVFAFGIVLF